ncbi:hypothetical protein ANO14919_130970 [Xylariales sp. No.14919]|nr:hypothetical protein ANO14919_130970 [Xylariales sp. No.14919]
MIETGALGEDEARPSYFRKEATADTHAVHDAPYEITLDVEEAVRYEYHREGWNNLVYAPPPKRPRPAMGATETATRERHVHNDLEFLYTAALELRAADSAR